MKRNKTAIIFAVVFMVLISYIPFGGYTVHAAPVSMPAVDHPEAIRNATLTKISKPVDETHLYDQFLFSADWSIPSTAVEGETFGIEIPIEFRFAGVLADFELEVPGGESIGTCKFVQRGPGQPGYLLCTFNKNVENYNSDIKGKIQFRMEAISESDKDTFTFYLGGKPENDVNLTVPGGAILPQLNEEQGTLVEKSSGIADDGEGGRIVWAIHIPDISELLVGGEVTITDKMVTGVTNAGIPLLPHKLMTVPSGSDPASIIQIQRVLVEKQADGKVYYAPGHINKYEIITPKHSAHAAHNISSTAVAGGTEFTLKFTPDVTKTPVENGGVQFYRYRIVYSTKGEGDVFVGDKFKNDAYVGINHITSTATWSVSGSASGEGKVYNQFAISKIVEGDAASKIPVDTIFTVKYTVGNDPEEKTLTMDLKDESAGVTPRYLGPTTFTIKEVNLPVIPGVEWDSNYTIEGTGVTRNADGSYTLKPDTQAFIKLSLINTANTPAPKTVDLSVLKTWDDANNQDGKRPESVTIRLFSDGSDTGKTLVLSEANNWKGLFKDLDEYKNDQKINYTVKEEGLALGYAPKISGDQASGYTIVNTLNPELVEVSGTKTWDDANNQDGKRPESITIRLLANGVEKASMKLTETDNWSWTFKDLPRYENGKEISYSISEDPVADYTTLINGYDVTNSYEPGKTLVKVSKVWKDADNKEGDRPESVTIKLLADGLDTGKTLVLSEANNWTGSFTDLDEYKDAKIILYSIEEVQVGNDYQTLVTGDQNSGFIVTNTRIVEVIMPGKEAENPKTGDGFNSIFYLISIAAAVILLVIIRKKLAKK